MNTILKACCFLALLQIGVVRTMSAAEPSPIPKTFKASIGGFMGGSYSVELHDGVLIYTTGGPGFRHQKQKKITPTAEQWREFRQRLDELKVWAWRPAYPNSGTFDGTQWSLEIAYPGRSLRTHGDNNYPESNGRPNGRPEATNAFNRYLSAVQKLTDDKVFQ